MQLSELPSLVEDQEQVPSKRAKTREFVAATTDQELPSQVEQAKKDNVRYILLFENLDNFEKYLGVAADVEECHRTGQFD